MMNKISPTQFLIASILLNILLIIILITSLVSTRNLIKMENKMNTYITILEQNLQSTKEILLVAKDSNSKIIEICDNSLDNISSTNSSLTIDNNRLVDNKDLKEVENILDRLKGEIAE